MQLKFYRNIWLFKWIPYDQFKNIIEKSKNGFATIHSAMWKDGSLIFVSRPGGLKRVPHQKVNLNVYIFQNMPRMIF